MKIIIGNESQYYRKMVKQTERQGTHITHKWKILIRKKGR